MAKKKFDPYQVITDSIIDALEAGTPPWRAQWKGLGGSGQSGLIPCPLLL